MTRTLSTPPVIEAGALSVRPQPVLPAAGGLLLRPWAEPDAPVFLSAYADEALRRWHTRRPTSEEQIVGWFDGYREDWAREKGAHWAVTGATGEVLGRIALRGFDFDDGVAWAGYWVLPAARGAGVATRALTAVAAWALDEAGFHRVELEHSVHNAASCGVAGKAGFALEGTKRRAAVHDDGPHDMHLHARVRGD
ncbi:MULTISPECIES: GNAT family N-acetyltransferase [Streptomyces]|uniref:GNAT family N-acetyltransferase n=2 Tax=Streptomyces TaxID=1883 RepID=A0ABU4KIC1_9ACTN|nr:GNAT family N-acetyltransferase [Streptomyces roseolus]MDX2297533.1 GNAT family N-acetyltransferase [Streptomyces roseolus]